MFLKNKTNFLDTQNHQSLHFFICFLTTKQLYTTTTMRKIEIKKVEQHQHLFSEWFEFALLNIIIVDFSLRYINILSLLSQILCIFLRHHWLISHHYRMCFAWQQTYFWYMVIIMSWYEDTPASLGHWLIIIMYLPLL